MESDDFISYIKENVKFLKEDQLKRLLQIVFRTSEHAVTDHSDGVRINLDNLSIDVLRQLKLFIENILNIDNI
jgi:hypothetical protein